MTEWWFWMGALVLFSGVLTALIMAGLYWATGGWDR